MSIHAAVTHRIADRWLKLPELIRRIVSGILLFLVYRAVAIWSYAFVIPPGNNAIFWLPSGITFAVFVWARSQPRTWPYWMLALFMAELQSALAHGVPAVAALGWSFANLLLCMTIALLVRKLAQGDFNFSRIRDVLIFGAIVPISVIPSGLVAAFGTLAGYNTGDLLSLSLSWAASDALGIFLLTPVLLSWITPTTSEVGGLREGILLFASLTTFLAATLFFPKEIALDRSFLFFLIFFVAWAAIRFGPKETSLALLLIDLTQAWATVHGMGPLAQLKLSSGGELMTLQILIGNVGILMLLVAAAIEEQRGARVSAEKALRMRDEFLSIASHELKTPLTSLTMQVQLLRQNLARERRSEASLENAEHLAGLAEVQVRAFSSLINSLLDVSRIRAGRLTIQREEIDLPRLIRDTLDVFKMELERGHCTVELKGDPQLVGWMDRMRMAQVVTNLLSNAMKYGGGKPIVIDIRHKGDKALITFSDRGIGIAKENQARIFERFERVVSPRGQGGLGLGLFIVRQIVEAHGGAIHVESEPGKGSSFKVEVPLHPRMAS